MSGELVTWELSVQITCDKASGANADAVLELLTVIREVAEQRPWYRDMTRMRAQRINPEPA